MAPPRKGPLQALVAEGSGTLLYGAAIGGPNGGQREVYEFRR